ncbi:MAG: fatty acid--CoA ligase family protein [Pseudomonadota bacterium]
MLLEAITRQAELTPAKLALIHNGVTWSYSGLAQRIAISRQHFAAQKLRPGSVVVLAIQHLAAAWVHGIALRSLGLNTLCVPAEKTLPDLSLARIDSVVTTVGEHRPEISMQVADKGWRLVIAAPIAQLADVPLPQAAAASALPEGGHVLMTSGTTGSYKMVLRDAVAEAASVPLHADINGISAQSVVYVGEFLKLTAGGYRWPLITWAVGGTVVFHQGPEPHRVFQALPVTHAFATPSTLGHLLKAPADALPYCASLRLLVTGGALPKALALIAQSRLTRQIFTVLASTEALTLAVTPYDNSDGLQWHHIHPAREVQVVDEAGQPLPAGSQGQLRVRVLDGVQGYLDDPVASQRFFRDGYFYPGDLGILAADGRLALRGRVTEVINVLGSKLAAAPLEQALQDALGATGVCIFSVPTAAAEEELHLAIESTAPIPRPQLEQVLETVLGRVIPHIRYHLCGQLPRNHMGKIQRALLQQQLLG